MSEVKVNTIKKYTGSSITIGESGDTITVTAGATLSGSGASLTALNATELGSGTIPNARYGTPTFDGSNLTNLPAETKPTISSINPSTIENTASDVVITRTNFVYEKVTVSPVATTVATVPEKSP